MPENGLTNHQDDQERGHLCDRLALGLADRTLGALIDVVVVRPLPAAEGPPKRLCNLLRCQHEGENGGHREGGLPGGSALPLRAGKHQGPRCPDASEAQQVRAHGGEALELPRVDPNPPAEEAEQHPAEEEVDEANPALQFFGERQAQASRMRRVQQLLEEKGRHGPVEQHRGVHRHGGADHPVRVLPDVRVRVVDEVQDADGHEKHAEEHDGDSGGDSVRALGLLISLAVSHGGSDINDRCL
mmetsp:Transcript_13848/g.39898  ORF Transcript_13848/g.39898 Transcript_13848/m.39898 type:complete len:243 (+) Transcript_13848:356-1084(+)